MKGLNALKGHWQRPENTLMIPLIDGLEYISKNAINETVKQRNTTRFSKLMK